MSIIGGERRVLQGFETGRSEPKKNFERLARKFVTRADSLLPVRMFQNACGYYITTADTLSTELTVVCPIL